MRIHNLVIDNIRGVEHLALEDIPDTGVILIHGENEAGKSTILDALDAVLKTKHTSSAASIRALNPIGRDEVPEVVLDATVGPYSFTVHKRFAKGAKGKNELKITAPVREELTGEQAHNRLQEILADHVDDTLLDALFMRQGQFTETIEAAGIPTFTKALERSEDEPSSADTLDDSGLMQRVQKEYEKFFSAKTGADKQNLKDADAAVAAAEEGVREAKARKASYEDDVDDFARSEAEMRTIAGELPEAEAELAQREEEAAKARELAGKLAEAKEKAERAEKEQRRAGEDIERRQLLIQRVDAENTALAEWEERLAPAQEKAEAEAATLAEKKAEHTRAREAATAAKQALESAEKDHQLAIARERSGELEDTVAQLDEVDADIARLLKALPERPVTDDDVRAIESATQNVALQRRLLDSAAARLDIATVAGTPVTVSVDGEELSVDPASPESVALHEGTQLSIGDVQLTYRAAPGTDNATHALEEAQDELTRACSAAGCESVEEARQLRDDHREAAAALEAARARRADILRGRETDELRLELTRLKEAAGQGSAQTVLSLSEAEAAVATAREAEKEASDAAHVLEVVLAQLAAKPEAAKLADIEARMEHQGRARDMARSELVAARETISDDDLTAAGEATALAHGEAAAAARALAEDIAGADPAHAEALREGAANRVANLKRRYDAARDRKLELGYRVTSAEGEAENLDKAEAALETARVRRDRMRRQAAAVKLLHDTLVTHRDAARAKYAAPFAQALQRYASRVFGPGTEFMLDDSLQVRARSLDGTTVDIDQLSGGAKEQLALLTRFAIADMVAGHSEESDTGSTTVPVVVDDALGATDPTRLELMNALFNQVGKNSQVFVLTCFPQRFDRVAAAMSSSIQELKTRHL